TDVVIGPCGCEADAIGPLPLLACVLPAVGGEYHKTDAHRVKLPAALLSRWTSPVDPPAVLVHDAEQPPSSRTAFEDRRTEKIGPGVTVRHGLVGKRGHRPHAFGAQPGDGARLGFSLQQFDEALPIFETEIGEGPRRHDDGGEADREGTENTREGVVGVPGDHLWGILLGQVYGSG